ncbi:MAG: AbrB/MazE/SpoVT family DNA-binding domain-containing protein [Clostridia bacterium]|nr:AbrB/MazE/SpoVT family DNA-binding domain-containing protein [Clostridia bacterium]
MKSLGIVRKVDELGRIVLPIETRKRLGLGPKDPVEIFVEKDRVVLKKYEPSCIFCGDADDIVLYKEKRICKACLEELKKSEL